MLHWLTFWLLQSFVTFKDNLSSTCLVCDLLVIIYECFTYPNTLYAYVHFEKVALLHPFVLTSEKIFMLDF